MADETEAAGNLAGTARPAECALKAITLIDAEPYWRRSRRCSNNGCIEVARLAATTGVAVRDSTRPEQPALRFSGVDWSAFLADIRSNQIGSR